MRIFSLCCVRDENDVIRETLEAALAWNEKIFVFDNASVDGTSETLAELAKRRPQIVLWGRDDRPFTEELRAEIFESVRREAMPGDWWCRLDSDEIYIDDPRAFLGAVRPEFGFVWSSTYNFYLTDRDVAAYEADPAAWRARPVSERLRYYQNNWSEPRFVRHRAGLCWAGHPWPLDRGRTAPARIRLRHFQYRSPEQIARRLAIRQKRLDIFPHEANRALCVPDQQRADWSPQWMKSSGFEEASWRDRVRPAAACDEDKGDGVYVAHPELLPPLPSPLVDGLRATVQATVLGRSLTMPVVRWRRRQRLIHPTPAGVPSAARPGA
jgi:hypothetical protein